MRQKHWITLLVIFVCLCALGQNEASRWQKLIDSHSCQEARALCTTWESDSELPRRVEAEKCLANVALCGNSEVVQLQGDDVGGGTISGGYSPEAIDEALKHLDKGIELSPQDLSIHQGRLHVLETAARYDDMAKALEESCSAYKGPGVPGAWLDYIAELVSLRQYRAGLRLLDILNKHYPNSHDVIGDMGALHLLLKEDDQAIPYIEKAVALAPTDPIDTWNLGRAYDRAGRLNEADVWYKKALLLDENPDRKKSNVCLYGQFVATKLKKTKEGCSLQRSNCESDVKVNGCVPENTKR